MKRSQLSLLVAMLPLLGSCVTSNMPNVSRAALRAEQTSAPAFDDAEIQGILDREPQLQRPFRLAVAPPLGSPRTLNRYGGVLLSTWSPEEEQEIREWGEAAKAKGLISELVFLPDALLRMGWQFDDPSSQLKHIRAAAARQRADAVVLFHYVAGVEESVNPWVILDLTLIAALFVPAHDFKAHAALDALVFDVRNEYLYLTARSESSASGSAAAINGYSFAKRMLNEARLNALSAIGNPLLEGAMGMAIEAGQLQAPGEAAGVGAAEPGKSDGGNR